MSRRRKGGVVHFALLAVVAWGWDWDPAGAYVAANAWSDRFVSGGGPFLVLPVDAGSTREHVSRSSTAVFLPTGSRHRPSHPHMRWGVSGYVRLCNERNRLDCRYSARHDRFPDGETQVEKP